MLGPLFNWLIYIEEHNFIEFQKHIKTLLLSGDSVLLVKKKNNFLTEYYQWFIKEFRLIGYSLLDKVKIFT